MSNNQFLNKVSASFINRINSNLRRTFFSHFSELKIKARLKSKVLFFTLRNSRKHHFARRTGGLAKTAVNFTDSEMYLPVKMLFLEIPFYKRSACYRVESVLALYRRSADRFI
jgi:hypothetical protein